VRYSHCRPYQPVLNSEDFYRQHCSQRKPPVFNLLRGRFWGFSPRRGDTLHRWGWNFACRRDHLRGIGPPKLKFLQRFDQNVEYKRPAGSYSLRDFHKICRVCTPFQDALAVKISLDLLKGLRSYGGFKLTGSDYPQISAPPSGQTMRQTPKVSRCKNVLEVLYHLAKFGGARLSPAAGAAKNVDFFVCLIVCLSSRFWTSEIVRPISPWRHWVPKRFWYRWVGEGL